MLNQEIKINIKIVISRKKLFKTKSEGMIVETKRSIITLVTYSINFLKRKLIFNSFFAL